MKNATALVNQYLQARSTMQLGTVADGQPWVCTVRFLADVERNLYWASLPTRRHSQEIANHPKVSCAIVVQDEIGKPVIGMQVEGVAEMLPMPLVNRQIVERYAKTFERDSEWVENFLAGNTKHRLYKLTPSAIYLIDEENLPGGQRHRAL